MDRATTLLALAAAYSGKKPEDLDPANLFGKGRIEGDDADEFWDEYARTFAVDLSDLRAYLHYDGNEPPGWRTAWGVGADGHRLPDIPIGIADLMAAADAGKWQLTYPAHRLHQRRLLTPATLPLLLGAVLLGLVWATFLR